MYAIVRTKGKQYKIRVGQSFKVDKVEKPVGTEFDLTDVLFVGGEKILAGSPGVKDAEVTVVISKQARAPKIIVLKKKRRQGYRKLQGHRQFFTELFVKSIKAPGVSAQAENKPKLYTEKVLVEVQRTRQKETEDSAGKKVSKQAAKKKSSSSGTKLRQKLRKKLQIEKKQLKRR